MPQNTSKTHYKYPIHSKTTCNTQNYPKTHSKHHGTPPKHTQKHAKTQTHLHTTLKARQIHLRDLKHTENTRMHPKHTYNNPKQPATHLKHPKCVPKPTKCIIKNVRIKRGTYLNITPWLLPLLRLYFSFLLRPSPLFLLLFSFNCFHLHVRA